MKQLLTAALVASLFAPQIHAEDKPVLKDQKDKVSYSIGLDIGSSMKRQKLEVDPELIVAGFRDGILGKEALLSEAEQQEVLEAFEKSMEARMMKESQELPERNKNDGAAFLAENKKKEGVKTHSVKLDNGQTAELQYKVIREGTGPKPKLEDKVKTHYQGTLIDGTEFDSSYKRNEPTVFGLRQVIKGWQETLQLMKTGAKWQIYVPSELAYGEKGAGRLIGPNATLIFDIELISIEQP